MVKDVQRKFEWVCNICLESKKIISFNQKILLRLAASHLATMHDLPSEEIERKLKGE